MELPAGFKTILLYEWVDNVNWPLQRDLKVEVSSVSPSGSEARNCELCVMELRYWLVQGNVKNNRIN